MQTVISGIQPTGDLNIGSYLGAVRNHVHASKLVENKNYFFVVDQHAITVRQNPAALRDYTYSIGAWYVASELDVTHSTLFVQSHVPAHTELAWLLNTFTQMGELERMTQFKDKAKRHTHNVNAGLFTYPVLMAADILLYDVTHVPVGEDQKQHLELTRDIAQRFNGIYGDVFVVPEAVIPPIAGRVMDLQNPASKMSKSQESGGTVRLIDTPKEIEKKVKRAVTDNAATIKWDKANQPGVTNLLSIYCVLNSCTPEQAEAAFVGKGYGDLKKAVAEAVIAELEPIQNRYKALMADKNQLDAIFAKGAEKANQQAAKKLLQVKQAIGFALPS